MSSVSLTHLHCKIIILEEKKIYIYFFQNTLLLLGRLLITEIKETYFMHVNYKV